MTEGPGPEINWELTTWEGSRREQLRRWRELSLREKLEGLEEMADLADRLGKAPRTSAAGEKIAEPRVAYSTDAGHSIQLAGCTPEPLMSYLKALGILRLVSEQKDPEARGWWRNDVFWLKSRVLFDGEHAAEAPREILSKFFLEEYRPTPIIAPWAGGSGFFRKDNKKAVEALVRSSEARVDGYARVIRFVQEILRQENIHDKPADEGKSRLIQRYRRELPDKVIAWMDAAMVLQHEGQTFAPVLGTGGNDGRLDFTQNFMQRLVSLGLHTNAAASHEARAWLCLSLFGSPARLASASVGQFAPGRAGGANATQGMEGDSADNPWDFVLMLEGALILAGAVMKRLGIGEGAHAAFPFTVRAVAAGFDSAGTKEEMTSRGELWLPLWERPAIAAEMRHLFGEGRAEVSGRSARNGSDFVRAIAGLGVDRGIARFIRLAFLKRSGKAFLAVPIGRFTVEEREGVHLLRQVDSWLDRFRSACSAKDAPDRLSRALHQIDSAVFDFCRYGGPTLFQRVLITLGRAELELAHGERFRSKQGLRPLAGLSPGWIAAADDGSDEFALALVLAGIHDPEGKIGPLRSNLEPVDWQARERNHLGRWAERDHSVVWSAADLSRNLAAVLSRRLLDGARQGCEHLPVLGASPAPLALVARLLAGELDDRRIEELLWGLILVTPATRPLPWQDSGEAPPLPRVYALLKLLFLPHALVVGGTEIRPKPEAAIPALLAAGHVGEACRIAARRLRAVGLVPLPYTGSRGIRRGSVWSEVPGRSLDGNRLAAALLIPIDSRDAGGLCRLVTRQNPQETEV